MKIFWRGLNLKSTRSMALVCTCLALTTSACGKLKTGVTAYYAGDYPKAIQSLKKIADKAAKEEPKISVSLDEQTTLEQALPSATRTGFEAWQAYAGSHFGLGKTEEGCKWLNVALRPIEVKVNGKTRPEKSDPQVGDYWQAEVLTLRAWKNNIPCSEI